MAVTKYEAENAAFFINLGKSQDAFDLLDNLDRYRKISGISRKNMWLLGMAMYISKNGDNPNLVMQIADYMENNTR